MLGIYFLRESGSRKDQQQRIRASRLRNEASSGVRIVFCFTMLFKIRNTIHRDSCQFLNIHHHASLRAVARQNSGLCLAKIAIYLQISQMRDEPNLR